MLRTEMRDGFLAGLPIALGYLSVSFGVGILASKAGMSVLEASMLSLTNVTSAGQAAGIEIIAAGGSLIEIIITQLVINIRYSLMAISLSQKLDDSCTLPHRFLISYGITDEIFAMAAGREKDVSPPYMYSMIAVSVFGWVLGTFLGATAGEILPAGLTGAMGIMLYGMFIAIVVPAAKKSRKILIVSAIAIALSCLFHYVLTFVTSGFAVIICALAASLAGAILFPVDDDEENA